MGRALVSFGIPLSLRDFERVFTEFGTKAYHATIWRWFNVTVPTGNTQRPVLR